MTGVEQSSILHHLAISVVIPSTGRSSLFRAVQSALDQEAVEVEVIVVVNGTDTLPDFTDTRVKVLDTRHTPGQGLARQAGAQAATNPIVALLDDDDFWDPSKCISQIQDLSSLDALNSGLWICATGLTIHHPNGKVERRPTSNPDSFFIDAPADYLFRRRSVARLDKFLQASSLMFPRELAHFVPFDSLPEVHTDWGWVLQTVAVTKCRLVLASGHGTHYDVSLPGVSKTNRYRQSLSWAEQFLSKESVKVQGDFAWTVSAAIASVSGDIIGVTHALLRGLKKGRPGLPAVALGLRSLARAVGIRFRRLFLDA